MTASMMLWRSSLAWPESHASNRLQQLLSWHVVHLQALEALLRSGLRPYLLLLPPWCYVSDPGLVEGLTQWLLCSMQRLLGWSAPPP